MTKTTNIESLTPQTQAILEQTSNEIQQRKPRHFEAVPFCEIIDLLQELPQLTSLEAFKKIGLSPSSHNESKNEGKCRLVTKYAIKGLIAEQTENQNHKFDTNELATLFTALLFYQKHTNDIETLKNLQKTISKLLIES